MKVRWTENAVGHLCSIYEYIATNSPAYGKRMVDRITRRFSSAQALLGRRHCEAPLHTRSRASGIRAPKLELGS